MIEFRNLEILLAYFSPVIFYGSWSSSNTPFIRRVLNVNTRDMWRRRYLICPNLASTYMFDLKAILRRAAGQQRICTKRKICYAIKLFSKLPISLAILLYSACQFLSICGFFRHIGLNLSHRHSILSASSWSHFLKQSMPIIFAQTSILQYFLISSLTSYSPALVSVNAFSSLSGCFHVLEASRLCKHRHEFRRLFGLPSICLAFLKTSSHTSWYLALFLLLMRVLCQTVWS